MQVSYECVQVGVSICQLHSCLCSQGNLAFSVYLSLSTVAVGTELSHRLETPGTQGKPLSRTKGHYKGS